MYLKEIVVKSSYESGIDNLVEDFYVPVLSCAISYDRIAGFFSSTSLSIASRGLANLIKNGGRMRLLACPRLSQEDFDTIKNYCIEPDQYVAKKLLFEVNNINDDFQKDHARALGWMLANQFLEIKIVQVNNFDEGLKAGHQGIFHQKIGIIKDSKGDVLTFSGSINETATAWFFNVEEFKVFKSWEPGQSEFVNSDLKKFNDFWNGLRSDVNVYDLPTAVHNKLIEYGKQFSQETFLKKYYKKISKNLIREENEISIYGKQPEDEIPLFFYQKNAVEKWEDNDYKLMFEMATGTGKTRTAIGCINRLKKKTDKLVTIISTPQDTLTKQWRNEIGSIGLNFETEIIADGTNHQWRTQLRMLLTKMCVGVYHYIIIYTTHTTASNKDFIKIIEENLKGDEICFVGDEAHGLGANITKRALLPIYRYRIGLSATPTRWFDDVGTAILTDYFGNNPFRFSIFDALNTINPLTNKPFLVNYYYHPVFVKLTAEELENYQKLTQKIKNLYKYSSKKDNNEDYQKHYERLLFARAEIQKNALMKYNELERIINYIQVVENTLIFAAPEQINEVMRILSRNNITAHRITQEQGTVSEDKYNGLSERQYLIEGFKKKQYGALVAISCLDEGIDIPTADTAIILASSTNPREYIQRVGRVIRQAPNKSQAHIYDFIIEPSLNEMYSKEFIQFEIDIYKKELNRVYDMAKYALNNAYVQIEIDKRMRRLCDYGYEQKNFDEA